MYAEASNRKSGDQAWLYSPLLDKAPNGACYSFWYHMFGSGKLSALYFTSLLAWRYVIKCHMYFIDAGTLRVFIGLSSGSVEVWNATGNSGNYWILAQINVTTQTNFEMIFTAEIGKYLHITLMLTAIRQVASEALSYYHNVLVCTPHFTM